MINIICGDIGSGKTTLLTYYLLSAMLDRERYRAMVNEINKRSANRAVPLSVPKQGADYEKY
jgi:G3E family GTPase